MKENPITIKIINKIVGYITWNIRITLNYYIYASL